MDINPGNIQFYSAELFQRYTLVDCIGAGGMGWVYRAKDTLFDDHEIALKVFYPHLVRELDTAQFEAEALIARRLTHAKIVQVYNYHRFSDEIAAMSMELIDGKSLAEIYSTEEIRQADVICLLLADITSGLAFAHSSGVLHRDIKPDNMMVNADGVAKVADFGIAQLLAENENNAAQKLVGTPHYMAPEQFNGYVLTPATDVYSFGILLYFLIHNHPPYNAKSMFELAEQHCNSTLKLETKRIKTMPSWCKELLVTCTEKSPTNRFSSMVEVAQFLSQYLDLELSESEKASVQEFSSDAVNQKPQYQYIPVSEQKTAKTTERILVGGILFCIVSSLFSDEMGYWLGTAFFTLLTLGIYTRPSIRVLNGITLLIYVLYILPYFNPYSKSLVAAWALDIEELTGFEAKMIKDAFDIDVRLSEPASIVELASSITRSAAYRGHFSLDLRGHRGETIFHHLRDFPANHYFKEFIRRGPDPNTPNFRGETPLFYSIQSNSQSLFLALINEGVKVDVANNRGVSPLALAVEREPPIYLHALLLAGANADRTMSDVNDMTVLEVATKNQSLGQVACLVRYGARVRYDEEGKNRTLALAQSQNPSGSYYSRIVELVKLAEFAGKSENPKQILANACKNQSSDTCGC